MADLSVSEVQARFNRRSSWWRFTFYAICVVLFLGVVTLALALYGLVQFNLTYGVSHKNDETHFKYGSIGAELANGLPYRLFHALPKVFPEYFGEEGDYSHFGFIYEGETAPDPKLPVGFARGYRQSIEVTWFNCAVCHAGKVQVPGEPSPRVILGMPANTIDLERFFLALFEISVDQRFTWRNKAFREAIENEGPKLSWLEQFLWNWVVIPNTRTALLERRSQLLPLLRPDLQKPALVAGRTCKYKDLRREGCPVEVDLEAPAKPVYPPYRVSDATRWGPGRVDTFNPYKMIHFDLQADCLAPAERLGAVDFPTIFQQGPRGDRGMHLHWDGNNASLKERNLSAAFGAGVTEETANFRSIARVADWLRDLEAPLKNPYPEAPAAQLEAGKRLYMRECASCHGHQSPSGYVFEGERLGQVEDIAYVQTDRGRLDSYTKQMEKYQKEHFFCANQQSLTRFFGRDKRSPLRHLGRETHQFQFFKKTNGYANAPLDALWLRAPYLHNGSVPTLADLLRPAEQRPVTFRRGLLELDLQNGGFAVEACEPGAGLDRADCFDVRKPGNGNGGHLYGVDLSDDDKRDLLSYLKTF